MDSPLASSRMLVKLEWKSNRVKGLSFHPKRPWLLASLHNGVIQLIDYRMGTLIDRFDEHDGPVRGVAFHNTQPLFVSGGDDYKIKVWNYKQRRCLFNLLGHIDYIRTVNFHHEHPWIISAADDQTIRIWNWQSRNCISILTGHNHYVMCAQFHPKEDLVVSASLDQTIRVWDISGLRKKHTAPTHSNSFEDGLRSPGQQDVFGNTDYVVKYVLEGHDRGVNWATFHPTLPLIISGADDRQVKLWRMNETKAWEVDYCRGHFANVSCVIFHPRQELIISNSEDKSIRVWDMAKRTGVQNFRREHDRFWILAAHPELNLFAAGHDSGLMVFKLERERPAYSVHQNLLFYVNNKYLKVHNFETGSENPLLSLRRGTGPFVAPKSLSYNSAEHSVLLCLPSEVGNYELCALPKDMTGEAREPSDLKKGLGSGAVFVARNKFAVLDKARQQIRVYNLRNEFTKQFPCAAQVSDIFPAGTGTVLVSSPTSMLLYDIQQNKVISELAVPSVRYAVWSADNSLVAFLSKNTITVASKKLEQRCSIGESSRVKSGAWDESGVFIYTTQNHIKYALPNGDNGIIRTLEHPVYVCYVKGKSVYCLDRDGKIREFSINPTEYRFKLALVKRKFDEVSSIIRNSDLVGQSIIAYLQKKGFPEIALHFVKDDKTRFSLALECGNLEVALETAKTMDREECWSLLADEALRQGHHQIVELCYQRTKNFERLSFLYLVTGNIDKLRKMLKIAELRKDVMSRYHNALLLGDIDEQIKVLRETGQTPLAYLMASTYGLDEEASSILSTSSDVNVEEINLPSTDKASLLRPPVPIVRNHDGPWPRVNIPKGFFDYANGDANGELEPEIKDEPIGEANGEWGGDEDDGAPFEKPAHPSKKTPIKNEPVVPDLDDGGAGWDIDEEELEFENGKDGDEDIDFKSVYVPPTRGTASSELWTRNSELAADHVAAGAFESAMQLLNTQIGVFNFAPLKPLFISLYLGSRTAVPGFPAAPALLLPIHRNYKESNSRKLLPSVANFLPSSRQLLQAGFNATTNGKFTEAHDLFRNILRQCTLTIASNQNEADEIIKLINQAKEYITGLKMEIHRKEVNKENPEGAKRNTELAAYFTHCSLETPHVILSLRSAMNIAYKNQNFATACTFARRLLELNPQQAVAQMARKLLAACEKTPKDENKLNYDDHKPFVICGISFTPIYRGSETVSCPYCKAFYRPEYSGKLCNVCELARIGFTKVSGIKLIASS